MTGEDPSASLVGMLGGDRADPVGPALELLHHAFPLDIVGVSFQPEPDLTVIRLAGPLEDADAAWAVSGALRAVCQLQQPHLFGPPGAHVYAVPRGPRTALGVRRAGGALTSVEMRHVDLIARYVR